MAEVPREISLTFTISNCIFRCHHCHSPYLQQDVGKPLLRDLDALIQRYSGMITCVCLMGEGQNMSQLERVFRIIRSHGLKTSLYSGHENIEPFKP